MGKPGGILGAGRAFQSSGKILLCLLTRQCTVPPYTVSEFGTAVPPGVAGVHPKAGRTVSLLLTQVQRGTMLEIPRFSLSKTEPTFRARGKVSGFSL